MLHETVRVIRLLEYVGTPEFIRDSMEKRSIKGRHILMRGYIQEAVLETPEALLSGTVSPDFVSEWWHPCHALDREKSVLLWLSRCPHCGRPHDYKEGTGEEL